MVEADRLESLRRDVVAKRDGLEQFLHPTLRMRREGWGTQALWLVGIEGRGTRLGSVALKHLRYMERLPGEVVAEAEGCCVVTSLSYGVDAVAQP